MNKPEFYDIVNMDDIRVSVPQTSHFSIGTSPYYAHQHGLAIDIYHDLTLENYEALSPVSGKILKVKPLIAPKPKFIGGINKDYLILISNPSNSDLVWKLMHVKPSGNVGDQIEIGDPLGKTIRNGYFAYWSSPHLHLEVRPFKDAIRARGGKHFSLAVKTNNIFKNSSTNLKFREVPVKIQSIFPEFILGRLPESFYHKIFPIIGVKVRVNQLDCLLDGGIPHYKIGTVISQQENNLNPSHSVHLGMDKIGTLHEINGQFGFLKFDSLNFSLNKKEIRGISLYLANFLPLIKIIPYQKNEFSFEPNSIQYLSISSDRLTT